MKKLILACLVIVAFATVAVAEEFVTSVTPITVLGQPCAVVKTVRKGGPLSGFLGTTQINQTTVAADPTQGGKLYTLSSSNNNNQGLGSQIISGATQNLGLGAMYAVGEAIRTPDQTKVYQTQTGVNAPKVSTSTSTTTSTATSATNVNQNVNNLHQSQGQSQFQNQRQRQYQAQELF